MTIMKKILNSFALISLLAVVFSCVDESLDPLQFNNVKKGTLLALRGTQLNNIYVKGIPGELFVPGELTGTEKFEFDGEYLSSDPESISSLDVYVLKKSGERVLVTNVPASDFKKTSDYPNPWVTVSIGISDILTKIGITPSYPLSAGSIDVLFTDYKFGISIETDLNLVDGTKVLAAELVASGLYQSNQFYPAQKLTYTVVKYCPEDLDGTYNYSTVVTGVGDGGKIANCPGTITGTGTLKKKAGAYGTYAISDATFGQYDCAWDDTPAVGVTLINTCDEISIGGSDQYSLVYSFTDLVVSPDGKDFSFKWENDYGDKGTTTLTRTDAKLWPLGLN
jgi:hypothetical protein